MHSNAVHTYQSRTTGLPARQGSLMVEMVVCTVLLSAVMLVLAPALAAVGHQRKATRLDSFTLVELSNIAERLNAGSKPEDIELSDWFVQRYSDTQLTIESPTAADGDDSALQSIRITISRAPADGYPELQRSLVVWKPEDAE